jgi:glutamine synthetase
VAFALLTFGSRVSGAGREFPVKGEVFAKEQVDAYARAQVGIDRLETTPSSVEYDMYFDA